MTFGLMCHNPQKKHGKNGTFKYLLLLLRSKMEISNKNATKKENRELKREVYELFSHRHSLRCMSFYNEHIMDDAEYAVVARRLSLRKENGGWYKGIRKVSDVSAELGIQESEVVKLENQALLKLKEYGAKLKEAEENAQSLDYHISQATQNYDLSQEYGGKGCKYLNDKLTGLMGNGHTEVVDEVNRILLETLAVRDFYMKMPLKDMPLRASVKSAIDTLNYHNQMGIEVAGDFQQYSAEDLLDMSGLGQKYVARACP